MGRKSPAARKFLAKKNLCAAGRLAPPCFKNYFFFLVPAFFLVPVAFFLATGFFFFATMVFVLFLKIFFKTSTV